MSVDSILKNGKSKNPEETPRVRFDLNSSKKGREPKNFVATEPICGIVSMVPKVPEASCNIKDVIMTLQRSYVDRLNNAFEQARKKKKFDMCEEV